MIKHNPLKIDYFKRTFYILSLKNKSYISLLNKNNIRTLLPLNCKQCGNGCLIYLTVYSFSEAKNLWPSPTVLISMLREQFGR